MTSFPFPSHSHSYLLASYSMQYFFQRLRLKSQSHALYSHSHLIPIPWLILFPFAGNPVGPMGSKSSPFPCTSLLWMWFWVVLKLTMDHFLVVSTNRADTFQYKCVVSHKRQNIFTCIHSCADRPQKMSKKWSTANYLLRRQIYQSVGFTSRKWRPKNYGLKMIL